MKFSLLYRYLAKRGVKATIAAINAKAKPPDKTTPKRAYKTSISQKILFVKAFFSKVARELFLWIGKYLSTKIIESLEKMAAVMNSKNMEFTKR